MSVQNLKLVVGDKNLSSWSMRAWLVMKQSELQFEEILVLLDRPETRAKLEAHSPSHKVPCLIHNDLKIWDSLAISEYISELAPNKKLWPENPSSRALARAYCAEMHSGFGSIRSQLSMDIRLRMEIRHLLPQTILEIKRILSLWSDALQKSPGPFLFGTFGIADAFYAPIVFRFLSYGIQIESPKIKSYVNAIQSHPPVKEWVDEGMKEKALVIQF